VCGRGGYCFAVAKGEPEAGRVWRLEGRRRKDLSTKKRKLGKGGGKREGSKRGQKENFKIRRIRCALNGPPPDGL